MPELPEVETTRTGIAPHVLGETITDVIIRDYRLRWPVPRNLRGKLHDKNVRQLTRRGKYLLFHFDTGCMIMHLGMSGSLRVLTEPMAPGNRSGSHGVRNALDASHQSLFDLSAYKDR